MVILGQRTIDALGRPRRSLDRLRERIAVHVSLADLHALGVGAQVR